MREIVSENKLLYSLYFHFYRKYRGIRPKWFTKKTKVYYDGYPRSGNTFLHHLFRNVFKDIESVHHLHKIAPIKIAFLKNLPVFVLVRDPKEAITSNYLKSFGMTGITLPQEVDTKLLNKLLHGYIKYYTFVLSRKDEINIIAFKNLIENPELVFKQISKIINLSFDKQFLIKAIESYGGASDKLGSSKPSDFKEARKNELKNHLVNLKNFDKAEILFQELNNY